MRELVPQQQSKIGNDSENKQRGLVTNVGAGSGYKLVHYLAQDFNTFGFETEPAMSFLRKTYPDQKWVDSGKPEESLPTSWNSGGKNLDLCICSDVIEHIREPDDLLELLLSLKCTVYVISTPKCDVMKSTDSGGPSNKHHVQE